MGIEVLLQRTDLIFSKKIQQTLICKHESLKSVQPQESSLLNLNESYKKTAFLCPVISAHSWLFRRSICITLDGYEADKNSIKAK